jgi:hypothetical protein
MREREEILDFERGVSASELGRSQRSPNWHGRRQFWIGKLEENCVLSWGDSWGKANIEHRTLNFQR